MTNFFSNIEEQILWQDDTHDDVKDYWREYRSIPLKRMRTFWQPWFGRERYVLTKEDEAPDLKAYLDFLIDQAEGIPVFKFVRAGLRAEWLRENYPDAQVVHIVRNPRSVWTSMMGRKCVERAVRPIPWTIRRLNRSAIPDTSLPHWESERKHIPMNNSTNFGSTCTIKSTTLQTELGGTMTRSRAARNGCFAR